MAWNQQGGGGQGPCGRGPGAPPPDVEELIRRSQDKFKNLMPGGFKSSRGFILIVLGVIAVWMFSGFYRVQPGEQGVELLFGKFVKVTTPGLNYWPPAPIGQVFKPNVEHTNQITIGYRTNGDSRSSGVRDVPQESLMLTGDQNIIDVDFVVQWRIKNAANFLFNIRNPEATVKISAESAIREVIGQTTLEDALTVKRGEVEGLTKDLLQSILDSYGAGVFIVEVKQQKVDPPTEVIDAFNDVQRAKQDQERSVNEAEAYRNGIVPRAKGEAARMIQAALAYKEKVTREAEGEAKRFLSVYEAYKTGKKVTTERLYIERMQQVLQNSTKVIIDNKGGSGVVPYLPLPELQKKKAEAK
jgi:membrane protease subunit HflK